jgi:predicted negative regulator of RcsB-dependent stress response
MEGLEYVSGHRSQIVKYVIAGIAAVVLIGGFWIYREDQHTTRENALNDAFKVYNSTVVGDATPPPFASVWFRTQAEQDAAKLKAFTALVDKYGNSDEGMIARFYLGVMAADSGKTADAEKDFRLVADNGSKDYASLAKLSLAQLLKADGKIDEGRKLIQSLIDKPTAFVSKDQATLEMARLIQESNPDEAKKLLEPLRTSVHPAVSQAALTELGELMQSKK